MSDFFYNIISKIYDTGMLFYFSKGETDPGNVVITLIKDSDKNLLDICAGTCKNSINISNKKNNLKITAIDTSEGILNYAKNKISILNISNIEIFNMDATNLTLENNRFDVVLISLALHEMPEKTQQKVLSEAKRVLNESGTLIVVEWDKQQKIIGKIKFKLIEILEPSSFKRFIKYDMKIYFENAGFIIDDVILCDYTKVYKLRKST